MSVSFNRFWSYLSSIRLSGFRNNLLFRRWGFNYCFSKFTSCLSSLLDTFRFRFRCLWLLLFTWWLRHLLLTWRLRLFFFTWWLSFLFIIRLFTWRLLYLNFTRWLFEFLLTTFLSYHIKNQALNSITFLLLPVNLIRTSRPLLITEVRYRTLLNLLSLLAPQHHIRPRLRRVFRQHHCRFALALFLALTQHIILADDIWIEIRALSLLKDDRSWPLLFNRFYFIVCFFGLRLIDLFAA